MNMSDYNGKPVEKRRFSFGRGLFQAIVAMVPVTLFLRKYPDRVIDKFTKQADAQYYSIRTEKYGGERIPIWEYDKLEEEWMKRIYKRLALGPAIGIGIVGMSAMHGFLRGWENTDNKAEESQKIQPGKETCIPSHCISDGNHKGVIDTSKYRNR